ncbi:chemotaxis protein CheW [Altericista sp. CCNU0014]|uniref:chemotaxis protein CheW n=1 Tax=Altericista sp. CCNU0014 TaxID=3082949 RepID=UPI00384E9DF3
MTAIASTHASIPAQSAAVVSKSALSDRFILTQVQSATLVIPAEWIAEIFRVERSQILPLPFYSPLLVGITHQGGRVLPLLSALRLLQAESVSLKENNMAIKLSDAAGVLAHVGLIVDRTLGSQTRAELPIALFSPQPSSKESTVLLRPETIDPELWQPLSWIPNNSL